MRIAFITGSRVWLATNTAPIEKCLEGADAVIVGDNTPTRAAHKNGYDAVDMITLRIAAAWDIISLGGPKGFVAYWERLGNGAGPERNGRMVKLASELREEFEIAPYALPTMSSVGTWDCVNQMKKAGFEPQVVWG